MEGVYSISNLSLIDVLCTMICKAFHAFLELSKLWGKEGEKKREESNGLRQNHSIVDRVFVMSEGVRVSRYI